MVVYDDGECLHHFLNDDTEVWEFDYTGGFRRTTDLPLPPSSPATPDGSSPQEGGQEGGQGGSPPYDYDDPSIYNVETLIADRYVKGRRRFLVRWQVGRCACWGGREWWGVSLRYMR